MNETENLPALTTLPAASDGANEIAVSTDAPVGTALVPAERKRHGAEVLDDDKRTAIVTMLAAGCSRRMAARHVQCDPSTITRTAVRDSDFAAQLAEAQAGADLKALRLIDRATDQEKYWRAAAWLLERRNPEEYGRRPPDTFTAEQVADVLAGFFREVLPIVPADCGQAVTEAFDHSVTSIAERVKRRYLKVAIADESRKPAGAIGFYRRTAADILMPTEEEVGHIVEERPETGPYEPWARGLTDEQLWGMARQCWDLPSVELNEKWLQALDDEWERRGDGRLPERVLLRREANEW
jgi:hypothetical protein